MLEEIMDRRNLEKALLQVERNKGAGGVDGMQTDKLRDYLNAHYQQLRQEVLSGNYHPHVQATPAVGSHSIFKKFFNFIRSFLLFTINIQKCKRMKFLLRH